MKTPASFVNEYNGKAIDYDGAYGVQCVDGFEVGCKYLDIPTIPTPNNWADGFWTCLNADGTPNARTAAWQEKYFVKIRSASEFSNGDWVIWATGSGSHPSSHVAMWYNGKEFGENQGGNRAFCLKDTTFSDALGALRPKAWSRIPAYESDLTLNGHLYHFYGQADGLRPVVISPGLNKTAPIKQLDTDAYVYAKITGCNYFQMREDIPDQEYGMTFGDISDPEHGVYQNLPNQDSTMYLDIETDDWGDCTGVNIDPQHNVFSPALIYQTGKNVQYARMVGLGLCNTASRYCFYIRYQDGTCALGMTDQDLTPNQIAEDIRTFASIELIAIIDGGGSAQMMRYLTKTGTVEYTRDTGRATAGCIALIGGPVPVIPEPTQDEEQKDEEEPMAEEKPQETPEIKPQEGWQDPEPNTSIIVQRIAALMSVKSILTLALTVVFAYLVMNQIAIPDFFADIYKIVILFFFGYQTGKVEGSKK